MEIFKEYFNSKIRSNMLFKNFNRKNFSFLYANNENSEGFPRVHQKIKKSINLVNLNKFS